MHAYHEALPGFAEHQIFFDGCAECERRSRLDDHGLSTLDSSRFVLAWLRAIAWHQGKATDISQAEAPLLRMLYGVGQRLLEAPELATIGSV